MRFVNILTLLFSLFLAAECRYLDSNEEKEGHDVVHSVPDSERPFFLAYALGHGFMEQFRVSSSVKFPFPTLLDIPDHLQKKFQELKKPENFTNNLYIFVKVTFNLSDTEMFQLILRGRICFPHRKCVDLENIGELCCPF